MIYIHVNQSSQFPGDFCGEFPACSSSLDSEQRTDVANADTDYIRPLAGISMHWNNNRMGIYLGRYSDSIPSLL